MEFTEDAILTIKNAIWDAAVSFDIDIRNERFMMSAGGHANENRSRKMQGVFDDEVRFPLFTFYYIYSFAVFIEQKF